MKIIILIPVFGRLQLFRLCADSIFELIKIYHLKYDIKPVIIISNNDIEHLNIRQICIDYGFTYIYWTNHPIGAKLNAVINEIYNNDKFDYLMNFGSDNLINPELLTLYKPYIESENKFFGINNVYVFDILTKRCCLFDCMSKDHAIGAGRMIHYEIIEHLVLIKQPLYIPEYSSGLDSCSASSILFNCSTRETIIDAGDYPYILDIKGKENINTFESLQKVLSDRLYEKDFNQIYLHFREQGQQLKKMFYDNNKA